jgi:hypothetical protein
LKLGGQGFGGLALEESKELAVVAACAAALDRQRREFGVLGGEVLAAQRATTLAALAGGAATDGVLQMFFVGHDVTPEK